MTDRALPARSPLGRGLAPRILTSAEEAFVLWTHPRTGTQATSKSFIRRNRSRQAIAATLTALACLASIASTALADQTIAYDVRGGDTVFGLARQFGVTPDAIATLNRLPDPNLLAVGQKLLITIPSSALPFGTLAPDRRDDLAAEVVSAAFAPELPSQAPPTLPPFGAMTPDRRADAAVDPATPQPSNSAAQSVPSKAITTASPAPTTTPAPASPPAPKGPPIIAAPYNSQFDGSIWAETNCGPTSLSMALGALGVNVDQITLRHLADKQMGFENPNDGTTWESLAYAAKAEGISNKGLSNGNGKGYRSWSLDDLKSELAKGHPVILLVHYRALTDHFGSAFYGDHYIVALGFDASGNLVYNDPAFKTSPGSDRTIDPANLLNAWSHTAAGLTRTAMGLYR
jgi:LysM repeat protein